MRNYIVSYATLASASRTNKVDTCRITKTVLPKNINDGFYQRDLGDILEKQNHHRSYNKSVSLCSGSDTEAPTCAAATGLGRRTADCDQVQRWLRKRCVMTAPMPTTEHLARGTHSVNCDHAANQARRSRLGTAVPNVAQSLHPGIIVLHSSFWRK